MPHNLKRAIVKPIIKKSTLDPENMKTYRPVSNLAYIGKIIEKVVVTQLDAHLTHNDLDEPLQSAYRTSHSTETALLKVSNDILLALDKRQCVYLVLLDLSAAFDTIDHTVFLSHLEKENGVTADALEWMSSYLSGRQQCVSINSTLSDNIDLHFGFPQGSQIGPFGFKLYTKPLTSIAKKHGINIHLYADDTQLYTSFKPEESEAALERLEACVMNWHSLSCKLLNVTCYVRQSLYYVRSNGNSLLGTYVPSCTYIYVCDLRANVLHHNKSGRSIPGTEERGPVSGVCVF